MKILITGDSWGRGEWTWDREGNYYNSHAGLQAYMEEDGHQVTNVSHEMGSNLSAFVALKKALEHQHYNAVIWLHTDPLRDLRPEYNSIKLDYTSYDDLMSASRGLQARAYEDFSSLGSKIYCIGGCGKHDKDAILAHNNLHLLIASVPELLLDDYTHPELWASDWIRVVDRHFDLDSLQKLLVNKARQDSLGSKASYKKLFWPDGHHPNRQAWRMIYDYIKPVIGL